MPNQPATQVRGFRLPDDLWEEIQRVAGDRGETYTELAIRALWRGSAPLQLTFLDLDPLKVNDAGARGRFDRHP